ncbi:MAG: hypothetical protein Q9160_003542 [Pyrenula sp. 1 TL-2023]
MPETKPRRIGLIHLPDEILLQILTLLLEAFAPNLFVYYHARSSEQIVHSFPEIKDQKFLLPKKDVQLHAQILRVHSRLLLLGRSVLYGSNVFQISRVLVNIFASFTPPQLDRNTDEHSMCLRHIFLTASGSLSTPRTARMEVSFLVSTAKYLCCLRSIIIQRSWIGQNPLRRNTKGSSDRALDQRQLRQCYDYEDSGNTTEALKIFTLLRDRRLRHDILEMQRALEDVGLKLPAVYEYQHIFRPHFHRDDPFNIGGITKSTVGNTIHFMKNPLDQREAPQREALSRHYCREMYNEKQEPSEERCNCRFRRYEVDTETGSVKWFEKNRMGLLGFTQDLELGWTGSEEPIDVQ